jgi:hypothetical protein
VKITEDQLLTALQAARAELEWPDGIFTVEQIARAVQRSTNWVRIRMVPLVDKGNIEPEAFQRKAINGKRVTVVGYRIKDLAAFAQGMQ